MLERIEDRFGTAGLIVAILALVTALGGSAYAASNALTSKEKKEVTKIAKQYAGKRGLAGPQGAPGANGQPGAPGKDGTDGTNGKSVTVAEIEPGEPECNELGGAEVKQQGATEGVEVCNGEQGSPWAAGGTLPPGSTQTGSFSGAAQAVGVGEQTRASASFNIPVSPAPTFVFVESDDEGIAGTAPGCPGISGGLPQAASGNFCVYTVGVQPAPGFLIPGATVEVEDPTASTESAAVAPTGAVLKLSCPASGTGFCWTKGVWAVTG